MFWFTIVKAYTLIEIRNSIKISTILTVLEQCAKDTDCGELRCFEAYFSTFIKTAINRTN
jgi:hypothetical protein